MDRRYSRAERLLSWLSTTGNIESLLAIAITVIAVYILVRFKM